MSGFFRCHVSIPMVTTVAADAIVNVWHFDSDQTFAEDADDVVGRLRAFYQAIDGVIFPNRIDDATIKVYDLADAEPRIPHITDEIVLTGNVNTAPIPNEVAMCLSFAAAPQTGVNPGRLRGRIFLGPLSGAALAIEGSRVRLTESASQAVLDAAETLAIGPDLGDARLAVFSPTTWLEEGGTPADLDAAFNDVVRLWIDNAPDTIRSRGERADARVSVTL